MGENRNIAQIIELFMLFAVLLMVITATETEVLLFKTQHMSGATNTINKIVDVFPANQ